MSLIRPAATTATWEREPTCEVQEHTVNVDLDR
jgi:hypothetical protein